MRAASLLLHGDIRELDVPPADMGVPMGARGRTGVSPKETYIPEMGMLMLASILALWPVLQQSWKEVTEY